MNTQPPKMFNTLLLMALCLVSHVHTRAANTDMMMRLSASTSAVVASSTGTASAAAAAAAGALSNHIDDASGGGVGAVPIRYDAPDDCRFHIHANLDVALACTLRTVNSEYDTTNFSVIPADHTVALAIRCNDTILAKSSLEPGSFAHLVRLGELTMEFCKLARLQPEALAGLAELRNLTLRTHNVNWPALSLEIEPDVFVHTGKLERLDLSMNNIWSLPESLFCALSSLRALNMSANRLQDVNDLGFREKVPAAVLPVVAPAVAGNATSAATPSAAPVTADAAKTCVLDVELLDVSHNHFVLLPANGFGILKRLRQLTVRDNEISMVDDKALRGLKHLQVLNLSSNKIVALPSELFADPAHSIQEIYLQNNSISVLAPKLFANLEQLQALDLADNKITSTWIDRSTFAGLIRLVLLNLSNNRITKLEPEFFADLYTLQILNLRYNQLETIAADTFAPMNNLHTLLLSHNSLKYLDAYALNGLYVLSLLALDNNQLGGVHPEAFRNCSSLQDLNLSGNQLLTVPLALKDMRLLRTVDLGENQIEGLAENSFRGMTNLYGLRLIGNRLSNVSKPVFKDLPSLQILNLAHNHIAYVEPGTFETVSNIQAIRLDGNRIASLDGLFAHMTGLLWLNVSDNQLTEFDYAEIPSGMLWLDLHRNEIGQLTDKFGVNAQSRLQTLDASFNRLRHVGPGALPNSIELLFLNDNWITTVEPHTFMHMTNLTRVDLYANQITGLDVKALRLRPVGEQRGLPEFYIGGNPFVCDCNIDWLQKINQVGFEIHDCVTHSGELF